MSRSDATWAQLPLGAMPAAKTAAGARIAANAACFHCGEALPAGGTARTGSQAAAVAIIQVTGGKAAGVGAMTWEFNDAGQWGFFEPGDPHAFLNSGEERVELIEVEIRK